MLKTARFIAVTAMLATAPAAHAASFTITSNNGIWQNPTSSGSGCAPNISGGGHHIAWGDGNGRSSGCGSQSSYDYDPRDTNFSVDTGAAFRVGTFTHENEAITGAELTSVNLKVSMSISGQAIGFSTPFAFTHDETQNPQGDHVVLGLGGPLAFTYGGQDYLFQLLGFKTSGGQYFSDFWTKEGKSKEYKLYAVITDAPDEPDTPTVPEPASLTLLGAALLVGGRRLVQRRD